MVLFLLMFGSRPDIAYAVSNFSQFSVNPNSTHWTAVRRIFHYLAGAPHRGFCYGLFGSGMGFIDAGWRGGEDRKSIGGYTFLLNRAAISWTSKKQSTVALLSTEAEYMALTQAVKESIWLQGLLRDLGAQRYVEEMQNIIVDNQAAIALARNAEFHLRTKHIDIQYHFVREHVEKKTISLIYCPTADMTADIFMKGLRHPSLTRHKIGSGLLDHSAFLLDNGTDDNVYEDGNWDGSTGEGLYY